MSRERARVAAPEQSAAAAGIPGKPAPGMVWKRRDATRFCEEPVDAVEGYETSWPDSAGAVAAARRALGDLVDEHMRVDTLVRTADGVFLKFVDVRPNVLDGSASVYVSPGPCVTLLGW